MVKLKWLAGGVLLVGAAGWFLLRSRSVPDAAPEFVAAVELPSNGSTPAPARLADDSGRSVREVPAPLPRKEEAPPAGSRDPDAIRDEYILSFFSARDRDEFLKAAARLGVAVLDTMKLGFSVRIRTGEELLNRLLRESPMAVEFSSNYVVRNPELPMLDPKAPASGYTAFGRNVLEWLGVADNANWGRGVLVAVLDTGVNPHPAFRADGVTRIDLLGGDGRDSAVDSAHGTAVASLIAGNSEAVRGLAPAAELLSVRVIAGDGKSDVFTAAKGIMMAVDAGATVINCSFGTRTDSFLLRAAVEYAMRQGAVIVASTGNEAVLGVSYPAGYSGVVGVSSVDARGEHMYFANRGDVGVAAPGLGIEAAWTANGTQPFSGTSASAPLVSGAIAAVLSQERTLTAEQAARIVREYSDDAGAPGRDDELGDGVISPRRVEQRDEPGIYDVAVGRPYLVPSGGGRDFKVSVFAQNTGTETLPRVTLLADVNGARHSVNFHQVRVGQTVNHDILLAGSELQVKREIEIRVEAVLDGITDSYPSDNVRGIRVGQNPQAE